MKLKWHPLSSLLSSELFPSLLSFPHFAVRRIAIVSSRLMCCGHCVYRLRMFLVFAERLETQREALRPTGIISSDKWRPKVLGRGLIVGFFSLSLSLALSFSLSWTGSTTFDQQSIWSKEQNCVYKNTYYFPPWADIPLNVANCDN